MQLHLQSLQWGTHAALQWAQESFPWQAVKLVQHVMRAHHGSRWWQRASVPMATIFCGSACLDSTSIPSIRCRHPPACLHESMQVKSHLQHLSSTAWLPRSDHTSCMSSVKLMVSNDGFGMFHHHAMAWNIMCACLEGMLLACVVTKTHVAMSMDQRKV